MSGRDIRAVILAGGRGARFWPLGRRSRPKQFLSITGPDPMLLDTVRRVRPVVPPRRLTLVADAAQTRAARKLLPRLPASCFLVEPEARNTAPALMLATARVWLDDPEAVVAVLPADHLIRDENRFRRVLRAAAEAAAREDALITFGVRPTYPATGYGYIRHDRCRGRRRSGVVFYPVLGFKEKPNLALADEYLASGDYAWNSGMFLWRAGVFAGKLERFAPGLVPAWKGMVEALRSKSQARLRAAFARAPALSIDYALMERAEGVLVADGDFGWSDVGAWSTLLEVWPRDARGNTSRGETLALESRGCLVWNPGRLTALVGVRDLIVVDAGDALLVCDASLDQKVKDVVEALERKKALRKYV
ncbi:MAG TPA: sugar phosphate nucleotidyltransferase [Candidatus Aminicenantes bacterium]|nr:sugar phosphate nucleotidyltransferase [Candidatus Aminicenantes bacterium]